ncbi:MAG: hypothetical protein QXV16_00465 [Candidatus Anstonellales archaeon]
MTEFTLIYLALLGILSYFDVKNNRNVPDGLVYIFYLIGFYQAYIINRLVILIGLTIVLYILYRLGVFGDAEVFILPVIAIDMGLKFPDVLYTSIMIAAALAIHYIYLPISLILLYFNPLLHMIVTYILILILRDRITRIRTKVDQSIIGEIDIQGKVIDEDYVKENTGKEIYIRRAIPYLPILLLSLLLVIYTDLLPLTTLLSLLIPYHLLF